MRESPHSCLLHLCADGFYLHITLQSILFPNECLFNIGTHTAAARGGRPEFLRVHRRETLPRAGGCAELPGCRTGHFPQLFTCKGSGMMTLPSGGKGRAWGWRRGAPCMSHLLPQRPRHSTEMLKFTRDAKETVPFSLFCAIYIFFLFHFGRKTRRFFKRGALSVAPPAISCPPGWWSLGNRKLCLQLLCLTALVETAFPR